MNKKKSPITLTRKRGEQKKAKKKSMMSSLTNICMIYVRTERKNKNGRATF